MRWTKLKQRVESMFAASVHGRVELHATRYRYSNDELGRGWITIDKKEIINMATLKFLYEYHTEADRIRKEKCCSDFRNPEQRDDYYKAYDAAKKTMNEKGIFSQEDFYSSLFQYLNLSTDDILESENVIIKSLGMLDGRIGKRRLSSIDAIKEPEIVRNLYLFRCEAERIKQKGGKV